MYAIRTEGSRDRLIGESDFIYIGSSDGNLRRRIRCYFAQGLEAAVTSHLEMTTDTRVYGAMRNRGDVGDLEIGWRQGFGAIRERRLLELFEHEHGELPSLNKKNGTRPTLAARQALAKHPWV